MKSKLSRGDQKNIQLYVDVFVFLFIIFNFVLNICNTKKVEYMYVALFCGVGMLLIAYFVYEINRKRSMAPIEVEDNYLAFYVSKYEHNKALKVMELSLDVIVILFIAFAAVFYFYKMDFINVYHEYPLFLVLFGWIVSIYILTRDISRSKGIDRVDALSSSSLFSIWDKKILFAIVFTLVMVSNVAMLSFKKPHFVVHFWDMVIYEIIAGVLSLLALGSILITKIYYSHFDLVQIEQTTFSTKYLEEIGKGAYSTVYKAFIPRLNKEYAVKKLDSTNPKDIDRFVGEFMIMKSLHHQNLLQVYMLDQINYEYVMDYCNETLGDYIEKNDLNNAMKFDLVLQLLSGMNYLHNHGIMHRDLSYSNIMIEINEGFENEPILKILDFGIAKDIKENKYFTRTMTRIRGSLFDPTLSKFKDYSPQNDIYLIGLIINYIYYKSDSVVLDESPIGKIIYKCLDVDLSKRYTKVSEIIEDFKVIGNE